MCAEDTFDSFMESVEEPMVVKYGSLKLKPGRPSKHSNNDNVIHLDDEEEEEEEAHEEEAHEHEPLEGEDAEAKVDVQSKCVGLLGDCVIDRVILALEDRLNAEEKRFQEQFTKIQERKRKFVADKETYDAAKAVLQVSEQELQAAQERHKKANAAVDDAHKKLMTNAAV